ncbi:MAG: 2-dehydro-3-deoxygalactonokinase, partial [Microvirga sp.]|nr:2-dehydro-3-deoxygalactonokinase [Microvirga sp.]
AKIARKPEAPDWTAFLRGVDAVRNDRRAAGLLTHLFAVRTGWLSGNLKPEEMSDYLSGLVVASEFREAKALGWFEMGDTIAVIGDDDLVDVYRRVGESFGLTVILGDPDCAVKGCLAIAKILQHTQAYPRESDLEHCPPGSGDEASTKRQSTQASRPHS